MRCLLNRLQNFRPLDRLPRKILKGANTLADVPRVIVVAVFIQLAALRLAHAEADARRFKSELKKATKAAQEAEFKTNNLEVQHMSVFKS
jgi:hypothetical protein